jgi:hypothetical protein
MNGKQLPVMEAISGPWIAGGALVAKKWKLFS